MYAWPTLAKSTKLVTSFPHQMTEYAATVGLMMRSDDKEPIAALVESLSQSLAAETKKRPHPLVYINSVVLLPLIFSAGVLYQRFNELEARVNQLRAVDTVTVKVDNLQTQIDGLNGIITRLTERLDRVLDARQKDGR